MQCERDPEDQRHSQRLLLVEGFTSLHVQRGCQRVGGRAGERWLRQLDPPEPDMHARRQSSPRRIGKILSLDHLDTTDGTAISLNVARPID